MELVSSAAYQGVDHSHGSAAAWEPQSGRCHILVVPSGEARLDQHGAVHPAALHVFEEELDPPRVCRLAGPGGWRGPQPWGGMRCVFVHTTVCAHDAVGLPHVYVGVDDFVIDRLGVLPPRRA